MKTLTFTHDDLFAIATDEAGRTYRVLLTSGAGNAYFLSPWQGTKAVDYRGRTIKEGHPLFAGIDAAQAEWRARWSAKPIDPKRFERFAAEAI